MADITGKMSENMATKRVYLKDLHRMMDGMGMELAEKMHLLFMANYIDYSNYGFRDDEQGMSIAGVTGICLH